VTELGRAVDLARRAEPPADARVAAALAQWAEALHRAGQTERALAAIAESDRLARPFESRDTIAASTARVLLELGRAEEALARVERALANARTVVAPNLVPWLSVKADALDRLGRPGEALEASSRAVEEFERVRARLVPEDAAKRGFAEVGRQTMAAHVRRLAVAGRVEEALEAGERARARAFLDLLATTDLRTSLPPALELETSVVEDRRAGVIPATTEGPGDTPAVLDTLISVRRGAASRRTIPEPDIASVAVVDPPTLHTVRSQAARLRSYLVSYWVAASETFIWLVDPEGAVTFVPVDIDHASLSGLVERTLPDAGAPTRSQTWRSAGFGPVSAGRRSASDEPRLVFGREAERANRELYRLLVAPVRNLIPEGSLVTLVPHGPLFRLAFAALTAPSGRYLIEDYVLHYAPSAGALAFTHGRRARPGGPTVVIADPDTGASFDAGEPLPRLPGAALEGHRIAAITGADSTRLLTGSRATEREVRAAATVARVLHIATHGIIRDDRPFDSFLALAGQGDAADDDGRLTMGEVYGLQLQAELVVLSACRTATGPVSGDGIIGLTRGFFAAGAPSVIASLWDLPDSVTASIFPVFYRTWSSPASRAEALREAQLAMIRELRAGRVTMETPVGRFTLPDHPSLWAGLILIGEP
jgi:CHAT domain-containing protein